MRRCGAQFWEFMGRFCIEFVNCDPEHATTTYGLLSVKYTAETLLENAKKVAKGKTLLRPR